MAPTSWHLDHRNCMAPTINIVVNDAAAAAYCVQVIQTQTAGTGTASDASSMGNWGYQGTGSDNWYGDSISGWQHVGKFGKRGTIPQAVPNPNYTLVPVPGPSVVGGGNIRGSIGISQGNNGVTVHPNPAIPAFGEADDGKVLRKAPPLEFNKFLNCSDLLELFLLFLKEQGVRRHQVMGLRFEYFVKWLIISAAEKDDEEPEVEMPALPSPRPHCLGCGKFMSPSMIIPMALHGAQCASWYFKRRDALMALDA